MPSGGSETVSARLFFHKKLLEPPPPQTVSNIRPGALNTPDKTSAAFRRGFLLPRRGYCIGVSRKYVCKTVRAFVLPSVTKSFRGQRTLQGMVNISCPQTDPFWTWRENEHVVSTLELLWGHPCSAGVI